MDRGRLPGIPPWSGPGPWAVKYKEELSCWEILLTATPPSCTLESSRWRGSTRSCPNMGTGWSSSTAGAPSSATVSMTPCGPFWTRRENRWRRSPESCQTPPWPNCMRALGSLGRTRLTCCWRWAEARCATMPRRSLCRSTVRRTHGRNTISALRSQTAPSCRWAVCSPWWALAQR